MNARLAALVAIGLATAVAFAPALQNGFVSFDDDAYITGNRHVADGLSREALWWALTERASDNWHPLTWISHLIDVELFGLDATGHHAVSAALHAASAMLLFWTLAGATGRLWPSLIVALLFALHPQRVESVAWAAERKDVLAGLFCMAALAAHTRAVREGTRAGRVAVVVAMALALAAKPMAVVLPWMLLMFDVWPLGRLRGVPVEGVDPDRGRVGAARLIAEKAPLIGLAVLGALAALLTQSRGAAVSIDRIGLGERLANAATAPFVYLRQAIWPVDLSFFYPHPALLEPDAASGRLIAGAAAALGLVAVTLAAWRVRERAPFLLVGWLWYLGCLLPVIGLVQVGWQARADRYTYLPMIGIAIAASFAGAAALRGLLGAGPDGGGAREARVWGALAAAGSAALALALILTTRAQVAHWRDDFRLYGHAIGLDARNYVAHNNLGRAYARAGNPEAARRQYEQALAARPEHVESIVNLGLLDARAGRGDRARAAYESALRHDPGHLAANVNYADLLIAEGRLDEAAERYAAALARASDPGPIRVNLAGIRVGQQRYAEAIALYTQAADESDAPARIHLRLGDARLATGDEAGARDDYARAIALEPGLLPAIEALARLLATGAQVRDGDEALRLVLRVREIVGAPRARDLDLEAAAHAARGDWDAAVRVQGRAVGLAAASERVAYAARLRAYRERLAP